MWGTSGEDKIYNLAKEAIENADVDFSAYDKGSKDGVIQSSELSIWIVHAGHGEESTHNTSDIWSHTWSIPGGVLVDGVRVSNYTMEAEDSLIGTFAHEFGHDLGLPDLYDTSAGEVDKFVGKWDIMAIGSWNGNPQGSSPAHFTSWSKIKLGWINSSAITTVSTQQAVDITINPIETSNANVINISTGSTYYLVEARKQIGYDASLPSYGVLILYCDDSIESGKGSVRVINAHPSDTSLDYAAFNLEAEGNSTFVDASRGITITVFSTSNSSFRVQVNYNASNVRISTTPSGLTIRVDGVNYTAPSVFTWANGSIHNISVPDIQGNGSVKYIFLDWSDGGGRTHTITAGTSDVTITANYLVQYFLSFKDTFKASDRSTLYVRP